MTDWKEDTQSLLDKVRQFGVTDRGVLDAMSRTNRAHFLTGAFVSRAYENIPFPISCGQTISQPGIVGLMLQELGVKPNHRVLEVGTGSGYLAVILSKLAKRVYSVERHRLLVEQARSVIYSEYKCENITVVIGDGTQGLPEAAPFDRIIVSAASEDPPPLLLNQLKDGGIMVLPVGRSEWTQQLVKAQRIGNKFEYTELCGVRFVPLIEGIANG